MMFKRMTDQTKYQEWMILKRESQRIPCPNFLPHELPAGTVYNGIYNWNPVNWRSTKETIEAMDP